MSTVAEIKGALSRLSPAEYYEITDWLSEHSPIDTPENIARIQRKLDEAASSSSREWTKEDWAKLGVKL
jgi:hypothetical protein